MSFPVFPNFKKLVLADRFEYVRYYSQFDKPYSDFSVNNLFFWLDANNDLEVSLLRNNIVLRFRNIFNSDSLLYTIVGKTDSINAVAELLDFLERTQPGSKLQFVPEETIKLIVQEKIPSIRVEEDLDNNDYVYLVEQSMNMRGDYYANLRNRINSFKKEYLFLEARDFDLEDKVTRTFVRTMLLQWMNHEKSKLNDPEGWEYRAIQKHLDLAGTMPVCAQGIYADGRLMNINIYHFPPQTDWVIFNHFKHDPDYENVFGYAFYSMLLVAYRHNKKWINLEQDLGRPGLRQLKMLLRPEQFLRRYTVWREDGHKNQ